MTELGSAVWCLEENILSHDKLEFNRFLMEAHVCGAAGGADLLIDRDITAFGIPVNKQMKVTSVSDH